MFKFQLLISLTLFLGSCSYKHFVRYDANFIKTQEINSFDSSVLSVISPYKIKVDEEMNDTIGFLEADLTKEQAESNLGNLIADVLKSSLEENLGFNIDFAFMNYGGIRVNSIAKGPILKGEIYELLPFDNSLVMLELKGSELKVLFDHLINKGGWPVSKEILVIFDKNNPGRTVTRIQNQDIIADKIYKIGTIDYLANGGDNCDFLKDKKRIDTGILIREALISFIQKKQAEQVLLRSKKEGRFIIR
jgi:2',3'-cyclic-nucleotide 2'-phosphodiesterase (5'-nucleotidase family)